MDLAQAFVTPRNVTHRQYEALRAYFVEGLAGPAAAERFGYTAGSFYQLVHQFRQDPQRVFFIEPQHPGVKADNVTRLKDMRTRAGRNRYNPPNFVRNVRGARSSASTLERSAAVGLTRSRSWD
jgi:hypothetical protein